MATGSIKKPFVGAQYFIITDNSDFVTLHNSLLEKETACVYISASVMNAAVGSTGSGHTIGTCCRLTDTVTDFCVNQSTTKIWHFRLTVSGSTPAFSNKTSVTLT